MNAAITTILTWFDHRWHLVDTCKRMAEHLNAIGARLVAAEGRIRDQNKLIVELQEHTAELERSVFAISGELNRTLDRLKRVEQQPTALVLDSDDEDFRTEVSRILKELVEDELRITVDFV